MGTNGRIRRTPQGLGGGNENTAERGAPKNTGRIRRNIGPNDSVNSRGANNRNGGSNPENGRGSEAERRMNIMDQTPGRRRDARERKYIDPNSPEVSRVAKESRGYKVNAPKQKGDRGTFLIYALMFLLVFVVVTGVCAVAFYANLIRVDSAPYDYLRIKICLENEIDEITSGYVDLDKYVRDGEIFINMTDVAEKFGFVITGGGKELKFITDLKSGENVKFFIDSPIAEVNGVRVRLDGVVTRDDGDVFVPKSFIE